VTIHITINIATKGVFMTIQPLFYSLGYLLVLSSVFVNNRYF
jgi:hypothetical protein